MIGSAKDDLLKNWKWVVLTFPKTKARIVIAVLRSEKGDEVERGVMRVLTLERTERKAKAVIGQIGRKKLKQTKYV